METIEIKNFKLSYDGIYSIKWSGRDVQACITLDVILRMCEIEGLNSEDIWSKLDWMGRGSIEFKKVILLLDIVDKSDGNFLYLYSDLAEQYRVHDLVLIDFIVSEEVNIS